MAYTKTVWTNGATALSAEHMNNIENGIEALDTGKVDKVVGKGLSANDYTNAEKTKLAGIATGAEVNQNAFSNIAVSGQPTVYADSKTDTLTFAAGSNITLTTDNTNDKVTIAATGGTYTPATQSAAGLMSAGDKTKLDGIEAGAEVNRVITTLTYKLAADVQISANDHEQLFFQGSGTDYSFFAIKGIHLVDTSQGMAMVDIMDFYMGSNSEVRVHVRNFRSTNTGISKEYSEVQVLAIKM